ncbi:site-specific integrase [Leeuwenhoekiella aequorea]|uniref:Site-specific recombinase XerD n=1 Tax=Leeuwenhoekiella aequorea TaxID=283736 RepID=A0A4Q0PCK7_9FLAO|nr:site-specific integrase [Leeuwenhoekiella aequorea]RXG24288.1 site-specific recombinase XerD [Leeuwenhoekiella aequorea]
MASLKTVLRKTQLKNDKYPIALRVTKDRKSKFFKTPFEATINEWDSKKGRFNNRFSNSLKANRLLGKIEDRALEAISDLEMNADFYTLQDFENKFRVETNPIARKVFPFWDEIIEEMKSAGKIGNASVNKDTKDSLLMFSKKPDLLFKSISVKFLDKYEVFLRSRGGTDGGIGVKMRALRAIFNLAIRRGLATEKEYPFREYKISKLKGKGIKKALNIEEVHKIQNLDLKDYPTLVNSRNYFVFSFYTRGMNFADMMKLKWSDISGDRIHYQRSKTKGNFIIKILPPVQEVLDYYKDNPYYVFPILLKRNMTPNQIDNRKRKVLKRYNKDLRELGKLAGVNKIITSYVARHSFANCLKQKGVATDVISESMGHQDIGTTKAYLKELDVSVIDDANELLL